MQRKALIKLRTFGAVELEIDGAFASGSISRPHILAMLTYLSSHPDGVDRGRLRALLWPDEPRNRATALLNQAEDVLRRVLGDGLLDVDGALRLAPGTIDWDVPAFQEAVDDGDAERALDLYRGPFLESLSIPASSELGSWVMEMRERLAARQVAATVALAETHGAGGDHVAAAGWWARAAALAPSDSRITLGLMRARKLAGDPAGALKAGQIHIAMSGEDRAPDAAVVKAIEELRSAPAPVQREPIPTVPPTIEELLAEPHPRGHARSVIARRGPLMTAAAVGLAVIAIVLAYAPGGDQPEPEPDSRTTFVASFTVYGNDESTDLGSEFARLLRTEMDHGEGGIRVTGTIVTVADELRITGSALNAAGETLGHATVEGGREDVAALAEDLAARLRANVLSRRPPSR
jgi:DNA-binding SARP family transcriptional activator